MVSNSTVQIGEVGSSFFSSLEKCPFLWLWPCFCVSLVSLYVLIILWRSSEPGLHGCLVDSVSECILLLLASPLLIPPFLSVPSAYFSSSFLFIPFPLLVLSKPVFLESWTPPVCVVFSFPLFGLPISAHDPCQDCPFWACAHHPSPWFYL